MPFSAPDTTAGATQQLHLKENQDQEQGEPEGEQEEEQEEQKELQPS